MKKLFNEALELINRKEDFALATVITLDGSAPRGPGAKMIIKKDGSIAGTIGGGLLEAEVMKKAADVIKHKKAVVKEFHLTKDDFSGIDMTCGGDLEVLIDFIDTSDPINREIFAFLGTNSDKKSNSFLVTAIPDEDEELKTRKQYIVNIDGSCIGGELEGELKNLVMASGARYKIVRTENSKEYIVEAINIPHCVYIFGAGHVGQKVASLMKFVNFHVTVIDDRKEFANRDRFPSTDNIIVDSFEKSFENLDIDKYSYIVIVTRGHAKDEDVLIMSLKTDAGYIGMIGSRTKVDGVYRSILSKGFTEKDIERVYSPIGLPIGGDSPEEIAVSIAAEIIKARSEINNSQI